MTPCAEHAQVAAGFVCDGCERLLCEECIEESYRLLLCRHCGERALPLDNQQPATRQEREKVRVQTTPYTLKDALVFPFRGTGLYILIMAFVIKFGANFVPFLILSLKVKILVAALIAALQFHIVRSTIRGENELDSWPDFTDWSELMKDLLAWLVLEGSFQIMIGMFLGVGLLSGFVGLEPSLPAALLFATVLWLGTGFQIIGYGVVASYSSWHLFMVHLHLKGFRQTFGDAIRYSNLIFFLRGSIFLTQAVLASIPILGFMCSLLLELYFIFMVAHLSGLLFRKHEAYFDRLYLD